MKIFYSFIKDNVEIEELDFTSNNYEDANFVKNLKINNLFSLKGLLYIVISVDIDYSLNGKIITCQNYFEYIATIRYFGDKTLKETIRDSGAAIKKTNLKKIESKLDSTINYTTPKKGFLNIDFNAKKVKRANEDMEKLKRMQLEIKELYDIDFSSDLKDEPKYVFYGLVYLNEEEGKILLDSKVFSKYITPVKNSIDSIKIEGKIIYEDEKNNTDENN